MEFSRRTFLRSAAIGTAAASLEFPLAQLGWPEPRRTAHPSGAILLNSNENAYGPLPAARAALESGLSVANRYPFGELDSIQESIAKYHGVQRDQVQIGCGSSEVLRVAPHACLDKGAKKLITATPTFEAVAFYAKAYGVDPITVPLTKDYAHDLDAMLAKTGEDTGLIYICNPNNPTGSLTRRKDLDAFLAKLPQSTYVLIDEAYHHFAKGAPDYTSYLETPLTDNRIIVARTFSKVYGLAGMRLGYSVATAETTKNMLFPFQQLDNVNQSVAAAGVASLNDDAAMHAAVTRNAKDRDEFMRQAAARGLTPIPSYCNFVMMDSGRPMQQVAEHFKKNGILIGRHFPPMDTFVRISLGKPDEMKAFWRVWDQMPKAA